jgi:hypothetical protein
LLADTLFEAREVLTWIALSDADGRERSAIDLAGVEDVDGAKAEDSRFFLGRVLVGRLDLADERAEDHEALFAPRSGPVSVTYGKQPLA